MAAFKIFAALLVACVAQACAGTLPRDKPIRDDTSSISTFGIQTGGTYFSCLPHLPTLFNVVQEIRGHWAKYQDIQTNDAVLRARCDSLEDEAAQAACHARIDDLTAKNKAELIEKVKVIIPKVTQVIWYFKECLLN